jgi:hypothetical protein
MDGGAAVSGEQARAAKAVRLTARERRLILSALRIASEDGSIYGAAETDEAMAEVNKEVEAIEAKLS